MCFTCLGYPISQMPKLYPVKKTVVMKLEVKTYLKSIQVLVDFMAGLSIQAEYETKMLSALVNVDKCVGSSVQIRLHY